MATWPNINIPAGFVGERRVQGGLDQWTLGHLPGHERESDMPKARASGRGTVCPDLFGCGSKPMVPFGCGSRLNHEGTTGLVLGSIYQGSIVGTLF